MEKKYERLTKSIAYPIIAKFLKSGALPSNFYPKEGLSESQFYTWRARYLKEHNLPSITEKAQADFHPIQVSAPKQPVEIRGQIELEYPNGVILRMETTLSDSRLAWLIKLY